MVFGVWVWVWVRRRRCSRGVATGIAYTFMVAAWGGFVFVVNLIALHGLLLVLVGQ